MPIPSYLPPNDWNVLHTLQLHPRPARVVSSTAIPVHPRLATWLADTCPNGVYTHQAAAITAAVDGQDVCLVTGTASGKTLAFHAAAIQQLLANPDARVIAAYPQKALARQQELRWTEALAAVGLPAAERVDGDVDLSTRLTRLRDARVLIMTPDVMHSWLMATLAEPEVQRFVRGLALVVIDELHVYAGVVGTNTAFLMRRLQHAHALLGGTGIRFFAASATIHDPREHFAALVGRPPVLVGEEEDGSPRHPVTIHLVQAAAPGDALRDLPQLIQHALGTSARFLVFCESRKQTELLATHVKGQSHAPGRGEDADASDEESALLVGNGVLPYRAGYEADHRAKIEALLQSGGLRGVISTSAMELGLDIPGLELAVLVGVPRSDTSLRQRIGRIGRSAPGTVWIVNTGTPLDRVVFSDPSSLLSRPPAEGALYLENPFIQYVHALCLARHGSGEHDVLRGTCDSPVLESPIQWPAGFLALCAKERAGELTAEQRAVRVEAQDRPHRAFPLRNVAVSFPLESWIGSTRTERIGSITYAQLMREAYPGAVYMHATKGYRVMRVILSLRTVRLRREKAMRFTTPTMLPVEVQPDLTPSGLHRVVRGTDGVVLEADGFVKQAINGYVEHRGAVEEVVTYPCEHHSQPTFDYTFHSSAAVLQIPAFNNEATGTHAAVEALAALLFEALLGIAPFERGDLGWSVCRYRGTTTQVAGGARFIAIYDQTQGSLRLSGRVLDAVLSGQLVQQARCLFAAQDAATREPRVAALLDALEASLAEAREDRVGAVPDAAAHPEAMPMVLEPASRGYLVGDQNREIIIDRVTYSPRFGELMYFYSLPGAVRVPGQLNQVPVRNVVGVPGQHQLAYYNLDQNDIDHEATAALRMRV